MSFVKEYGVLVLVAIVGVGILLYGLWGQLVPQKPVVEIVKNQEVVMVVDVAGAVEKPGIYKLPSGSRIGDALVMARGLSAEADREWVARTLNLAQDVKDGQKIYIPTKSNNQSPSTNLPAQAGNQTNSNNQNLKQININVASASELDALEGIGEARAAAIITNRPYASIEELVSKAKIPQSVYEKIKDRITVY